VVVVGARVEEVAVVVCSWVVEVKTVDSFVKFCLVTVEGYKLV
jgi:hypothetical protein